jgi:hypothetical protein
MARFWANSDGVEVAETPKQRISPLAGEMAGRPEGGDIKRCITSYMAPIFNSPAPSSPNG